MVQNDIGLESGFTRFNAERTRGFSDRKWVFDDLHKWLTEADGTRFFLLSGEPGSGKTAIAARLYQFAQGTPPPLEFTSFSSGFLSAYHFCSIPSGGSITPQRFAESLALQLSAHYPAFTQALATARERDQRIQIVVDQHIENINGGQVVGVQIKSLSVSGILPEDVFNRVVREPLRALFAAERNAQVLILVDALDEALTYEGKVNIVSLLAQTHDLPAGVRFILTCRNDSRVIDQFNPRHLLNLSALEHIQDTDDDIHRYVQQRMAEESMKEHMASIGSLEEVKDHLIRHAAGNFLYAQFFLDEVIVGKRSLANIVGLPVGLFGLYRQYLDSLLPDVKKSNTQPKWISQLQPLLGSLSVAVPAAPQDVLPSWLQLQEGIVGPLLDEVNQLTERDPGDGGSYRLYHRSMAEFLITREYQEENAVRRNWYYTPSKEQHERIARYYLTNFRDNWQYCDLYGLRQLVWHMQACLSQEQLPKKQSEQIEELYAVVLDPEFQRAQREKLGDTYVTLTDLRTTLEIALARNDLVKALACIGCYRDTKHNSRGISQAVFDAAQAGNFERALQRAAHYTVIPKRAGGWESILQLYIVWEAAEQGNLKATQKMISETKHLPHFQANESSEVIRSKKLSDAFLARIANALARTGGDTKDAKAWLTQWDADQPAQALLTSYGLAQPLEPTALQLCMTEVNQRLTDFEQLVSEGNAEAVSMVPFYDEELVEKQAVGLQDLLTQVAAHSSGQESIDQILQLALPNPYPHYRDIALVALGVSCLAVPETSWVRSRLQAILRTALDQEGVTFTFDLSAILLAEAEERKLPAQDLSEYLAQALESNDRWGTSMRARSASAAVLFRKNRTEDAKREWEEAIWQNRGFAGYAVVTLLSLINRSVEFGLSLVPDMENLISDAGWQAEQVRNLQFRAERMELVRRYREWAIGDTPDNETVLTTLSATADTETRKAFTDFISARWAGQKSPNSVGMKSLLLTTLADGTTLDILLGRLFGPSIRNLSNSDLTEAIRLCATYFTRSRPWELGQWH